METKIDKPVRENTNLVGMYAFLIKDKTLLSRVYVLGKADDTHYICQFISPLTGEYNIANILSVEELKYWQIIPTLELANEVLQDYYKNGWRY